MKHEIMVIGKGWVKTDHAAYVANLADGLRRFEEQGLTEHANQLRLRLARARDQGEKYCPICRKED